MPTSLPGADPRLAYVEPRQQGFALLIMLIILVMGSLYAVTSQLEVATRKYARDEATFRALALAKEALIGYAVTYRDDPTHSSEVFGYLLCPDQTGDGSAAGTCGSAGLAAVGLLPYKTLGLPDLRDADGNCLWYAVSGTFKNNIKASASVMNWDTQGQFSITGTTVAPEQGDGGAVAVIFAAGPPLQGQSRNVSGGYPCQIDPAQVTAFLDGNYNFSTNAMIPIAQGASGSSSNNDHIAWITPKEIFDKVVKRQDVSNPLTATPPGQINKLTDEIKADLEKRIQDDLTDPTTNSLPDTTGYTPPPSGKRIGKLPAAMSLSGTYGNYLDNWREQYRQVMCASLITPCLSVTGTSCRGGLMFGGSSAAGQNSTGITAGQPRPNAWKTPSTANLGYYFESPSAATPVPGGGLDILNLDISNPAGTIFSGSPTFSVASPSADLGICLFPGDFKSFTQDIGSFTRVVTSSSRPEAAIDVAAKTVTLGNPDATSSGRGCVWNPTQLAFNSSLRAYFKMNIANFGEGFIFAVVDAPNNQAALSGGTLCGTTTGALMGYSSVDVAAPKFGLEIDTRTTTTSDCSGSNRNDPSSDHMAIVYWGTAASTSDDNCHNAGTLGSGSEPLNPRSLSAISKTVQSASWTGNVATITTSASHGLATNQQITLVGITPSAYNGTFPVAVIDATHFAYSLAGNPGAYVSGGTLATAVGIQNVKSSDPMLPYSGSLPSSTSIHVRLDVNKTFAATLIQAASWSANSVTITTAASHGLLSNQRVSISNSNPSGYNGTYAITVTDSTHFTYALGSNPGSYSAGGQIRPPLGVTVQGASRAASGVLGAYTATITTATAHGFISGQPVTIAGVSPAAYNGTYQIVAVDATHFTYALGSNPGAYTSGGSLTAAVALTLKAYVASNFPNCTLSDFQNLSRDLSSFCVQTPSVQQDNVYMNVDAATGKALATIFSGFTNAQSSSSSSEQTVTISNFIIKTQ